MFTIQYLKKVKRMIVDAREIESRFTGGAVFLILFRTYKFVDDPNATSKKSSTPKPRVQKAMGRKRLATLKWTKVDSDGSLFSRGKRDYYAILVRGIPEDHPKDCIVELYVTDKELTIFEIKVSAVNEQIELLSRSIVNGVLLPVNSIDQVVEEMKNTAEKREAENPYTSFSSGLTSRGH